MNVAGAAIKDRNDLRERRCIVTGEVLDEAQLIRFALDPDGNVVPDIAATLPGRGLWVKADRDTLNAAVARNAFSKAAKAKATVDKDLVARVERLLAERMLSDLGLARRAGQLVLGFDNVARALQAKVPPAVVVEASDGSADGKRKLFALAKARNVPFKRVECLNSGEISVALGRENVIHAALQSGRLSERLVMDAGRLSGLRAAATNAAGPNPATDERDE